MKYLDLTLSVFYIILLVFIIVPISYWNQSRNNLIRIQQKSILLDWRFWIPALVYSLLLGFRWDYAYDWNQYYNTFNYIQHGEIYRDTTEKGYLVVNYLLGHIGFNFYSIFILEGFLYIFSIYTLLNDKRRALIFALPFLYIAARFNCLNISRQFFAQSIVWVGFYYLLKKRTKIYVVLSLVACTIHTSAIIWTPLFYIISLITRFPKQKVVIGVYVVCWLVRSSIQMFFSEASDYLTFLDNKGYDSSNMMGESHIRDEISIYRMILQFIINLGYILSSYYVIFKLKIKNEKESLIIFVGIIGVCLNVLGGTHEIFNRFFWYFSYLYYIGWGLVLFYLVTNKKTVPLYIWLFNLLGVLQILWSMYPTIIQEVMNNHYIHYKVNFI